MGVTVEFHEIANLFPLMEGPEYEALVEDIRTNGLHEAIWTHGGKIIDGRNRYRACKEAGIEPRFSEWNEKGSLLDFVLSMNLHRRHLNETQRAVVVHKIANMPQGQPKKSANLRITQPEAAKKLSVSVRTVQTVAKIEREAPDLIPDMEAGTLTAHKATKIVAQRIRAALPAPVLPEGKYRVIYADPPWEYDNSGFDQSAASHYPTMSQEELCALPVADLAPEQCILFLWATSPLLPVALEVMAAWGFMYKASRVWIKDRAPGMGWFINTRHEFLLIGVKGSGMHPSQKLDSVFESPVTRHSAKPISIYEDIESCYEGPYIELFARSAREGWGTWGNEV